ncbi:MAG: hypothetical protein KUG73_04685 [Pseudomonadales bacterium]|nr:hypothetical protein [Pseudomonadales bacterium]
MGLLSRSMRLLGAMFFLAGSQGLYAASGCEPLTNEGPAAALYPIVIVPGGSGVASTYQIMADALCDNGARVHIAVIDGFNSYAERGKDLRDEIDEYLAITGAEKVNVIAQSAGTMDTRYYITYLGGHEKIGSFASMAGPHNGATVVKDLLNLFAYKYNPIAQYVVQDLFKQLAADQYLPINENDNSDVEAWFIEHFDENVDLFNENNPNHENVHYEYYAGRIRYINSEYAGYSLFWAYLMAVKFQFNDGIITNKEADGRQNGEKYHIFKGSMWSAGVSHLALKANDNAVGFDAADTYVDIVTDMKGRGH